MTFLKGLIITMLIAVIIIVAILYMCLIVGSNCDDQMGYDDENERH